MAIKRICYVMLYPAVVAVRLVGHTHVAYAVVNSQIDYCNTVIAGASGLILTAIRPFQLPASRSGTLSRILSGTRRSVLTASDVHIKRICSLDTS